ncbi:ErmE/ErmH/ErmO/ErmR family 23S rRNA (adenine(2058)-N(6))-methyltransferase [Streptomyces sp. JJ36]|uniref:ErmE/ErmH/ErmO/ErmR family 23S rRNA (adenine(2058)-N(6))-methyltransferase n=1 Tax=Streptomyces sp. JJ36 TaxID=2736645 RepID=UPI001F4923A1|nr:ErmE/ErmH/ErmO/ErmR family 23S rRNA (adenine(2058)-N(6))-methyltransferase [Streptomyces sp. JJ36]MCF6523721.1 ErmE/ErmH/ErmO/ErmR family 23S rRNA (adenine(2058)-N(6))-methyltransferase [Streptomyces sp. JJ36]
MARRRTTLSQNFLHDPAAVRRIVRAAALAPDDLVVEPGAGEGALTRALARSGRRVVAYELDHRLAAGLPRRLGDLAAGVRVVHGDFLRADPPREPFAVVGNIPYSRTADIVRWCLAAPALTSATLLTQLEYARKRTGGYGRWSLLTVRTWPEYAWRRGPRVGRAAFTPVPRTDSAVLRLVRRPAPLLPYGRLPAYRAFVEHGFTGTGGSLAATLSRRHRPARVRAAFRALGLDPSLPVGLVHPDHWAELFRALVLTDPHRRAAPRRPA